MLACVFGLIQSFSAFGQTKYGYDGEYSESIYGTGEFIRFIALSSEFEADCIRDYLTEVGKQVDPRAVAAAPLRIDDDKLTVRAEIEETCFTIYPSRTKFDYALGVAISFVDRTTKAAVPTIAINCGTFLSYLERTEEKSQNPLKGK